MSRISPIGSMPRGGCLDSGFRSVLCWRGTGSRGSTTILRSMQRRWIAAAIALLHEIDGLLNSFSPYSEERDLFSTALLGTSEILKIDSEGRVILTESVKEYAGITAEVTFVGQGHKFQIWEPGRFRAHLDEARSRVRDLRKQLSARTAAADQPRPRGARE